MSAETILLLTPNRKATFKFQRPCLHKGVMNRESITKISYSSKWTNHLHITQTMLQHSTSNTSHCAINTVKV